MGLGGERGDDNVRGERFPGEPGAPISRLLSAVTKDLKNDSTRAM